MKVSMVIPLDPKNRKKVDQYRFQYDRGLIKLFEPVIELFPAVEAFINLKRFQNQLSDVLKGFRCFKVDINGIGSALPDSSSIFFLVEQNKNLVALRNKLTQIDLFEDLNQEEFIPHIVFHHNGDLEKAESIYESLIDETFKSDFFVNKVYLITQSKSEPWEIVQEYLL